LVERNLAKVEVASSRLVSRSNYKPTGGVAEWLCSGLQSRGRRFDSDPRLQKTVREIKGLGCAQGADLVGNLSHFLTNMKP
jgi:hypothetical protein